MLLNGSTNAEYLLIEAPCYRNKIGVMFYLRIIRWDWRYCRLDQGQQISLHFFLLGRQLRSTYYIDSLIFFYVLEIKLH